MDIPSALAKQPERSDFEGNWLRADGTYRFEIEVADSGEATARYFNPSPINVESATFEETNGQPKLTVVLRDRGYPGSTYRLAFVPEHGILAGTYKRPRAQAARVHFLPKPKESDGE